MDKIWGVEHTSFTLSQTLSISFISSASTLALVNVLSYILIFPVKNTTLSRLIIAFLVTWWLGSSIDYIFDLLLAGESLETQRVHRIIENAVVRAFYISSTELFNWSMYKLFCSVSDDFQASFRMRRFLLFF